jgi:hypothetical protein
LLGASITSLSNAWSNASSLLFFTALPTKISFI